MRTCARTVRNVCLRVTDGMGRGCRDAYFGDGASAVCFELFEDVVGPAAAQDAAKHAAYGIVRVSSRIFKLPTTHQHHMRGGQVRF